MLDNRNVEAASGFSLDGCRFYRRFAYGLICHIGRDCSGSWSRYYADSVIFFILPSNWFIPAWRSRLDSADWNFEFWVPDCWWFDLGRVLC